LVYALQASGGTIFTHLLAQTAGSVAILDLWASKNVPAPEELAVSATTDVMIKVLITVSITVMAMVVVVLIMVVVVKQRPAVVWGIFFAFSFLLYSPIKSNC
jgi:hypothetical protein